MILSDNGLKLWDYSTRTCCHLSNSSSQILREAIVQLKIMKHIREEDESDDDDGSDDDKKKERLEERIKHLIYIAQVFINIMNIRFNGPPIHSNINLV